VGELLIIFHGFTKGKVGMGFYRLNEEGGIENGKLKMRRKKMTPLEVKYL